MEMLGQKGKKREKKQLLQIDEKSSISDVIWQT